METIVYIDGFNLYYGALKGTPYKWLDLDALCQLLLPKNNIKRIKYFTAHVSAHPHDPGQPVRQGAYLRALRTLPNMEIIFGHFLAHNVSMPLANTSTGKPKFANVIKTEEKGSDVNLATHLINDGYKGEFEVAALITNDSDLREAVRIVRQELNLIIGIINPQQKQSRELITHASFVKKIRKGVLKRCQFPTRLTDATGMFSKPGAW